MKVELLHEINALVGECPVWDSSTDTLYSVDILNKRIYANGEIFLESDEFIGCVAPRQTGGLVFTRRFSVWTCESDSSRLTLISSLKDEPAGNRFNDGKCDPRGRFLAGTMDMEETEPKGSLYSFEAASVTRLFHGSTISNGMAWSPDHRTFYYIDTPTHEVKAYDYDLESGSIANARTVIRVPHALGHPDGMTSDSNGHLWIAMWGGAQITKWDPATGQLMERIPVPAKNTSSCAFGGPGLNELFVTSARVGLDEATLREYPLTGSIFRIETDVEGMPAFTFAG